VVRKGAGMAMTMMVKSRFWLDAFLKGFLKGIV
jgi:hypothetical protein